MNSEITWGLIIKIYEIPARMEACACYGRRRQARIREKKVREDITLR